MGQELTQVLCPECGAPGESDPEVSRWQCSECGNGYFLRRCSACARVSYVDGLQGFRLPWPCTWCGQFNRGFSPNQDPAAASAAELAAEVTRYGPPGGAAGSGAGDQADPAPVADSGPAPAREPGDRGLTSAAGIGGLGPTHPLPGLPAAALRADRRRQPLPRLPAPAPRAGRRRALRIGLSIAVAAACASAATVLLTAGAPDAVTMAAVHASTTRSVLVTATRVGSIDFQGVPGQLTIVGTGPGQVILTGQLHGTGSAPVVKTRFDRAAGVLALSVQCPPATQCTENLRLAVPGDTGTAVRQPGGRIVVTGLAGSLRVTATNVDISASDLRSADLAAVITSGNLSATFAAPPRQVSITLASAQATLHLPDRVAYRVSRQVISGYIRVAIPQAASATRAVTARIDSGELELLPS